MAFAHLHVITTQPDPAHRHERLCMYLGADGGYRIAAVTRHGTLTRLPYPPTADLDEAYGSLIQEIRRRRAAMTAE